MAANEQSTGWVFVSHSSEDLAAVRRVRNHLEEQGAAPLLFHLKALSEPEEFWPLIEREIAARSFFLLCDSRAARESPWVQREIEAVERLRKTRAIRVRHISVEGGDVDFGALDGFLALTRVFPSYSWRDRGRVAPFMAAIRQVGFSLFDDEVDIRQGPFHEQLERGITDAAQNGWVVIFVSSTSLTSSWVREEIAQAHKLGARLVPVLLDDPRALLDAGLMPDPIKHLHLIDASTPGADGPKRLVGALLSRSF